ncbi:MAG: hypothetical protein JWM53_2818, partial [bacterium]|nr:hypothetical protein [bacterium]
MCYEPGRRTDLKNYKAEYIWIDGAEP